ncbi:MAG: hypothetical protein HYX84_07820 [Chloroflexi bacterium]|nr:hypothetical protein [Chloroflexota bacterium]
MAGYMGKNLWVNLATGEITSEVFDEKLYWDFIGGYGVGARIIYSRQKPGADPRTQEVVADMVRSYAIQPNLESFEEVLGLKV